MNHQFKPGEKIVCVDNKGAEELIEKEIYTVVLVGNCEVTGRPGVVLEELGNGDGYFLWRFRKLDHQFAEDLLRNLTEEVSKTSAFIQK